MLKGDPFARFDVESLLRGFTGRAGLLVAVSGGPDSMALLRLAARWRERDGRPPVFAATVDHGLRDDSAGEAEAVGGWSAALGVPHEVLVWEGTKPLTRLQERAREERYRLLIAHAGKVGADTVLLAHHASDQAETVLLRLTRGSGVGGLAGMAAETTRGGVFLARPMLKLDKSELVTLCEALGQGFFHDPSNENSRFARVRLRRLATTLAAEGLDRDALLRLARRARRVDAALTTAVDFIENQISARRSERSIQVEVDLLRGAPLEILIRFLDRELSALTGARPRYDRLEALAERLGAALAARERLAATLGGARLVLSAKGVLVASLESPRGPAKPRNEKDKEKETCRVHSVHLKVV